LLLSLVAITGGQSVVVGHPCVFTVSWSRLKIILDQFADAIGLRINFHKSTVAVLEAIPVFAM
jgi:hypothetical protein